MRAIVVKNSKKCECMKKRNHKYVSPLLMGNSAHYHSIWWSEFYVCEFKTELPFAYGMSLYGSEDGVDDEVGLDPPDPGDDPMGPGPPAPEMDTSGH